MLYYGARKGRRLTCLSRLQSMCDQLWVSPPPPSPLPLHHHIHCLICDHKVTARAWIISTRWVQVPLYYLQLRPTSFSFTLTPGWRFCMMVVLNLQTYKLTARGIGTCCELASLIFSMRGQRDTMNRLICSAAKEWNHTDSVIKIQVLMIVLL